MGWRSFIALAAAVAAIGAAPAAATVTGTTNINPIPPFPFAFPSACIQPDLGTNYRGAEVEPWVAANPAAPGNLVAVWQQDRWSNGGSNGLFGGVSLNGGASWAPTFAAFTHCTGGNAQNGQDYQRATDPWVTFSPNGVGYWMGFSFNSTDGVHEINVARSTNSGSTWSNPITLRKDLSDTILNDKNSMTADPGNANYVYGVWDRLVFPNETAKGQHAELAAGYTGPAWFARTINGGASWEPARLIYDPALDGPGQGRNDQTIGNQIVVLPNGTLVDGFNLIHNDNAHQRQGSKVALIRSIDKGATWETHATVVSTLGSVGVADPTTGAAVRTSDIIPEIGVDRSKARTKGNLYFVWQDAGFNGGATDAIAFSKSSDGGTTWTAPVRISNSGGKPAFTPAISVNDQGTIAVTYYDFRNDSSTAPLDTDVWTVTSTDGGATWREQHLSGPFDMTKAPVARGHFVGDYIGQAVIGNGFHPVWVEANGPQNTTEVYTTTVTAP